jgi:hypothetical protein
MSDSVSETTKLKQKKAIAALLNARDLQSAAQQAGVSERTIYRWMDEDPGFLDDLKAAEADAIKAAGRRLVGAAESAITVILYVMLQNQNPPGVRLRAAQGILDQLIKFRNLDSIEERIAALENVLSEGGFVRQG